MKSNLISKSQITCIASIKVISPFAAISNRDGSPNGPEKKRNEMREKKRRDGR